MNTRMVAPNVEGEYYKSVHDFLQHNFPERDDKIYCSIWGFKENQKVSADWRYTIEFFTLLIIHYTNHLLHFSYSRDEKFIILLPDFRSVLFSAEAQICNMNIFILYSRRLIVGILQTGAKGGGEWWRDFSPHILEDLSKKFRNFWKSIFNYLL